MKYFGLEDPSLVLVIRAETKKVKVPFRSGTTVGEALKNFIELKEQPKVSTLNEISKLLAGKELIKLKKTLQNDMQMSLFKNKRYGILDILEFLDIKIPFE